MTGTTKDLDYYAANPDEMPTDEATLDALLNGEALPNSDTKQDETGAPSGAKEEGEGAGKGENQEDLDDDEAPVLTKDGKHALPYSVLKSERERRQAAEPIHQDMSARLEALEEQAAAGTQAAGTQAPDTEDAIVSDEDLAALREDFPAFANVLDSLKGKIGQLEGRLSKVAEREAEAERQAAEESAAQVRDTVQANIVGNPVLSFWQAEKPKMFAVAIAYDNEIKADPRYQELSMAQRFEKVVELVENDYGKTILPAGYGKGDAKESDDKALAAKAKEALEKAGKFTPPTPPDLPAGMPPAERDPDKIERMSVGDLAAQMDKMTPQQIADLLAKSVG